MAVFVQFFIVSFAVNFFAPFTSLSYIFVCRGELRLSPVTGKQEMYYPPKKTLKKLFLGKSSNENDASNLDWI